MMGILETSVLRVSKTGRFPNQGAIRRENGVAPALDTHTLPRGA